MFRFFPRHRRFLLCALVIGLLAIAYVGWRPSAPATGGVHDSKAKPEQAYPKLPLSFEVNEGQFDPRARFVARGQGYQLTLGANEAVIELSLAGGGRRKPPSATDIPDRGAATTAALRMKLAGANRQPRISGLAPLPGKSNYLIGNDPSRWRTNVNHYARVKYEEVYPGIDLVYYGKQQELEYDFVVAPGADARQIRLQFAGAEQMRLDEAGDLVLTTRAGEVRQQKPVVYQETGDRRQTVTGRYVWRGAREVGFEIGAYDPSQPLVIDPVVRYATYAPVTVTDVAVDNAGDLYLCGYSQNNDVPTTPGVLQSNPAGGPYDVFVMKLRLTLTRQAMPISRARLPRTISR